MTRVNAVILEDDPYFSKAFKIMLERTNKFQVTAVFSTGEEFIAEQERLFYIEVIFLDIELPGISGSGLGKNLREIYPHLQVVFVTGKPEFAVEAFDLEATDYKLKYPLCY